MANREKRRLTIKQLESYLQDLNDFERPKIRLEQYATPPHIAALILNTIDLTYDDIDGKFVADLGCGTGRLTIGSLLCGAKMVYGFDIDGDALHQGLLNVARVFGEEDNEDQFNEVEISKLNAYRGCERFNFVQADLATTDCDKQWDSISKKFDTVIMNPPFGTKQNQGLDMIFLKRAIDMSEGVVYSLHKTSTRDYILNMSQQHWGVKAKPIAQIRYNLENTYKFHKRKSIDIDVDLWRIKCRS